MIGILSVLFLTACENEQKMPVALRTEIVEIWEDGLPKLVQLYGKLDGQEVVVREIHYYPDGQKWMEGPLLNGQRHGLWKSWFETGILWSEGSYENGKRQGKGTVYHPNGKKFHRGSYENGKRSGKWEWWDDDGDRISEKQAKELIAIDED